MEKRQRYPLFDWLRLVLALEVVALHWFESVGLHRVTFLLGMFEQVPSFLALSGFMIAGSLASSRNMAHFWWKRFLRIARRCPKSSWTLSESVASFRPVLTG